MRKTLLLLAVTGMLAGTGAAAGAATLKTPGAGKPNCVGVTPGTTNAGPGGVSQSGGQVYFTSVANCLR